MLRVFLSLVVAICAFCSPAYAAPIAYTFRISADNGALVSGATVAVGATTLTAGTPATVTAQQLGSASSLSCSVTYFDRGNGDYVLLYDPVAGGEAYIPLTVSKSATTITAGNALVGMTCPQDSGIILGHVGRINTAQGATSTTITLDAAASATDNAYTAHFIKIVDKTGAGQFATISGYVGATKVATITRPAGSWSITPDSTSVFEIEAAPAAQVFSNLDKANYVLSSSEHTAISGTDVPNALTAQGYTGTLASNLGTTNTRVDAAISTRLATSGYTTPPTATAIRTEMDSNSTRLANLDASVSSRLATSGYTTAPTPTAIINALLATATPSVPTTGTLGEAFAFVETRLDAGITTRARPSDVQVTVTTPRQ